MAVELKWRKDHPREPILEFRGVTFADQDRVILDNISFKVSGGETRILLGRNGAGKSLIMKLANGLLKPDEGIVRVFGKDLTCLRCREIIADENEHYKVLSNLIGARPPIPNLAPNEASQALEVLLAARRQNNPEAATWFSNALYAANDGLGSIFCVVSGVAGATLGNSHFILLAGFAGMVGSSLSAGTSAYLASKSEREVFQAGFERERTAVETNEAEAREVLTLSYQSRGLPADVASRLVHLLAEDKQYLIRALARARLNTTEEDLSVPWVSVISGTLATALGAFVPIIPFFFMAGVPALITATIISLAAHFAAGAARSIMTIRPWWSTGLELTAIGGIEGAATYGIGMALGYFLGTR